MHRHYVIVTYLAIYLLYANLLIDICVLYLR